MTNPRQKTVGESKTLEDAREIMNRIMGEEDTTKNMISVHYHLFFITQNSKLSKELIELLQKYIATLYEYTDYRGVLASDRIRCAANVLLFYGYMLLQQPEAAVQYADQALNAAMDIAEKDKKAIPDLSDLPKLLCAQKDKINQSGELKELVKQFVKKYSAFSPTKSTSSAATEQKAQSTAASTSAVSVATAAAATFSIARAASAVSSTTTVASAASASSASSSAVATSTQSQPKKSQ